MRMQPIVGRLVHTVIVTSYTQTHLTGNTLTSLGNLNNYTDYWTLYVLMLLKKWQSYFPKHKGNGAKKMNFGNWEINVKFITQEQSEDLLHTFFHYTLWSRAVETKKTLISSGIAVLHVFLCSINVCFLAYFYWELPQFEHAL